MEYAAASRAAHDEARTSAFSEVEIHREPAAVLAAWAELEAVAPASAYQTRDFLLAWLETLGAARKIAPLFVIAKDRQGEVLALLCLGIEQHGPLRCAVFLGGKESNFNLGLFRPGANFAAADLMALLRAAAAKLGTEAPDAFLLKNQPVEWEGVRNCFLLLKHRPSPSFAYATALHKDPEAFFAAKLGSRARKKLRKKEQRLATLGVVAATTNDRHSDGREILDAFFAEKIARCEEQAIDADFSTPAMRAFFERMSQARAGKSWLELYALTFGGRIVATYAGALHRGQFSAMVNSFDTDPEIAKSSPGDLLLMKVLGRQCERGVALFDLGIGKARYKATYCDIVIPLFDVVVPLSLKGHLFAAYHLIVSQLKQTIKKNPQALARLRGWKRLAAHLSGARSAPRRGLATLRPHDAKDDLVPKDDAHFDGSD